MVKNKRILYYVAVVPLIVILSLVVWFFTIIFEGEKPRITLLPKPEYLSGTRKFVLETSDMKRGLKQIKISVNQEGRSSSIFEKKFAFEGFLNRQGSHSFKTEFFVDPSALNLAQGRVDLNIQVWDYSRRGGGDGNMTLEIHRMIVDTLPPSIRALTTMHNINLGGTGLVLYQASSDTEESGVYVDNFFSPGFPVDESTQKGVYVDYFAIPYDASTDCSIHLWARDKAGNRATATFYTHIREKRFRKDRIEITDRFLSKVLPYFSFYSFDPQDDDITKYLKINRELRKENHLTLVRLREKTSPKRLWEDSWLRLKNAATMATFGTEREYYYKGEKVDVQVHLGVDLASLANSPVPAANNGRVIYAGRLGIYGLAVVLDHGQGLLSVYGHLSNIEVSMDQEVKKGDTIGTTGETGLAGGDHLHFSIMVNGVMVNPIEWWDDHWINDNISRKLALLDK